MPGAELVVERPLSTIGVDEDARPYRPHGANLELFRAREHEVVLEGPADCGKSRACLEKLHLAMVKYPGARAAIVRQTRKSLTATAMATFERQVASPGSCRLWNGEEYRYPNGSKVYLFGLDDPERLKSFEGDLIYVQEVSEVAQRDYELLTTRVTGRGSVMPYQQIIADLNPREPNWWLYDRETAGTARFLHVTHADNPTITAQRLAPLEALTGYLRDRLLLGLRVAAEGMYFTEFDPRQHLVEAFDPPEDWVRWVSVDYGFAHPFVALWYARERPGGHIYVYREVSAIGLRDEQQARLIVERSKGERIALVVLDPSMFNPRTEQQRPSIAQVYAENGAHALGFGGLVPGFNSRTQGWAVVRRALAHGSLVAEQRKVETENLPRLKIMHARCPNLVRNLPAMVMDPLDPEDLADKIGGTRTPDDECLVEGTLVLTARGQVPIEEVSARDQVWTRLGWQPVLASRRTRRDADVLELQAGRYRLQGTANHPVWVHGRGWVPLEAVRYGDRLLACASSLFFSGESHFVATPTRRSGHTGCTSSPAALTDGAVSARSIRRSGEQSTDRFRRVITFTTSTEIHSTTQSRILPASIRWRTPNFTPIASKVIGGPGTRNVNRKHVTGAAHLKAKPGIARMLPTCGSAPLRLNWSVISAASLMLRGARGVYPNGGFAQTHAKQNGDASQASMTSSVSASAAERASEQIGIEDLKPVRVDAVRSCGTADVYNLTVANAREYFAGGLLVHNCDALRYGLCAEAQPGESDAGVQRLVFG